MKGLSGRLNRCSDARYRNSRIKTGKICCHIWKCLTIIASSSSTDKSPFEIVYGKEFKVPGRMSNTCPYESRGATDTASGAAPTEATDSAGDCR